MVKTSILDRGGFHHSTEPIGSYHPDVCVSTGRARKSRISLDRNKYVYCGQEMKVRKEFEKEIHHER